MERKPSAKTKRMVHEAVNLMIRGASDSEVRQHIAEAHGLKYGTQQKIVKLANREIARRHIRDRGTLLARQNAKLEMVQRAAMAGQKVWATYDKDTRQWQVHKERSPDLSAFSGAVALQNKLHGLDAPERKEVVVRSVELVLDDLADLLCEFLPDQRTRRRFHEALGARVAQRLRERPDLVPVIRDLDAQQAKLGSGPVIEAEVVERPAEDGRRNGGDSHGQARPDGAGG